MKHFAKQLTMGALLGLAVMVGGVDLANANLLNGHKIRTTVERPQGTISAQFPAVESVVGAGVEIPSLPNTLGEDLFVIDFQDTSIHFELHPDNPFDPFVFDVDTFNGIHFEDIMDPSDIAPWVVEIDPLSTVTPGLTFDDNNIYLNFSGLSVTQEDMVWVNVKPVPEPSTMLLLGSGLAGIVAWRYRREHA